MSLKASTVITLFRTELRMVLRDRRTIITSIILPLIVMPLILLGSKWSMRKREQSLEKAALRYSVSGSHAEFLRTLIAATRERLTKTGGTNDSVDKAHFRFVEVTMSNSLSALARGDLQLVLECLGADEVRARGLDTNDLNNRGPFPPGASEEPQQRQEKVDIEGREPLTRGAPVVRIVFRADRDDSVRGMRRMEESLRETRRAQQAEALEARGFPLAPSHFASIKPVNLASKGQVAGMNLGRMITLFFLLFIMAGGAVVATDLLAGEKERGTLETLLTTGASRGEIVAAKHLIVLSVALIVTLIQTINLLVYVGFRLIPTSINLTAAVPPQTAILLFVLFLPIAALAASVLLLTSGYAKTYKEAQLYFLPVLILGLLPAMAPLFPGIALRSAIVLVPIANIAIASKDILVGTFDWPMILAAWCITGFAAAWTMRLSARFLSAERLITTAETDRVEFAGGAGLFERSVWRWFAGLWAVLLIVNNYSGTSDVRLQLVINLVILFLGTAVLLIQRYRLDPQTVFALRAPKPVVWLAILFAVPSGLLTGVGLFRLADLFIPVPRKVLEGFSEAVIGQNLPVLQMVFFFCLLPGILEEMMFRGLLLHGLHRRLHPATLAIVVGLTFGIFHIALFRIVPVAFLGVLFATVTMLTGSIFPAMLWHALNNAIGVFAPSAQAAAAELSPIHYLAAATILAASFWIMWRNRTPYPGLRPWRSKYETRK